MRLPVVVLGPDGRPVRGLTRDDFEIVEDGVPQAIAAFAEGAPGGAVPLHLGLMLDRSESMALDLGAAAEAAVRFIDALDEAADVTFVAFDSRVELGRFTPPSYPQLFARIRATTLGDRTALYDAMARALDGGVRAPGPAPPGRLHRRRRLSQRADRRRRSRSASAWATSCVYVIGYLEHQSPQDQIQQRGVLAALAHETGGEAFFPSAPREVDDIYTRIRGEVESRYTLGYVSSESRRDGRLRHVRVRLRRETQRDLIVRTRPSYVARPMPR